MKLAVHSNKSYHGEPKIRSRAGEHFSLFGETTVPCNNVTVLNIAHIIKHARLLATEAALAGLYIVPKVAVETKIILQDGTQLVTNTSADRQFNGR